jgi:hypothetical protein
MTEEITILSVEKDGEDGVIVSYSDGTICGYLAQELLELRPCRECVKKTKGQNLPQIPATHE